MKRLPLLLLLALCTVAATEGRAAEAETTAREAPGARAAATAPAAPVDICATHDSMLNFAREAGRLVAGKDTAYFVVKQRLIRVNDHYLALHDSLATMMPPKTDAAAEALWRFDALGELLQESGENLERLGREMKTAMRVCAQDLAAYETEFGEACPEDAKVGCSESVYVRYCSGAKKRNRVFKIDEGTHLGFLKWPRFFDSHWAGPTKVGEAGEGWREEWTYGTDEQVWHNIGVATMQDENRLEALGMAEQVYSNYTMIDTKPLFARMLYNEVHGTAHGGTEKNLMEAIDNVTARVRRVMRCEVTQEVADKPMRIAPADASAHEVLPRRKPSPDAADGQQEAPVAESE